MKFFIIFIFLISSLFSSNNLEKVSLQLHWKYQFEFAGFIAAVEKGFYKDEGLEVELKEFNYGVDVINEVLSGNSNYGIYNSNILSKFLEEKPLKLISSYYKRSALVLITKPEIRYPIDLKNKKIMAAGLEDFDLNFGYVFSLQNIDTKELNLVPHNFDIKDFALGKVDAMTAFISDQPYKLDKLGVEYNIINPSDFGVFNLQLELFTSKDEADKYIDRTEKFQKASIKGWEYALENPNEIIQIILEKYNTQNLSKEFLENEALITQRLIMPKMYKVGSIDELFLNRQIELFAKKEYSFDEKKELIKNFLFHTKDDLEKIRLELNYDILKKTIPIVLLILLAIFYREKLLNKHNKELEIKVKQKTNEYKLQNKELLNSNKNFTDLVDTAIETIAIFDKNYNLVKINEAGLNMLHLDNNYLNKKINLSSFISNENILELENHLKNKSIHPYEIEIKTLSNKTFPALISGKKITRNSEDSTIITLIDLTEIKLRDQVIQEQLKLAQMGELLNMIAHQWRQPLTAITASTEYLRLKCMLNDASKEDIEKTLDEVYTYTSHLSKTINDFKNFYKDDKEKKTTSLNKLVEKALNIIEDSLKNENIKITNNLTCKDEFKTCENEITHVILSILQNAQEALINNKIKNPEIRINTFKKEKNFYITIEDNGGGIKEDIFNKIFDPYFSTKKEKNGTGLGLYFAKKIIETNCEGELTASNSQDGAKFTLKFKEDY